MELLDRLLGRTRAERADRTSTPPRLSPPPAPPTPARASSASSARAAPMPVTRPASRPVPTSPDLDDENNHRLYAAPDGNAQRFIGEDGLPTLHLIRDGQGEDMVLRFCEDSTGLLVGPTDRRLLPAGLLVSNLRGGRYYERDCRAGDFATGAEVRLVPEPDNPHDSHAVAVFDPTGRYRAGYVNKQKARAYLKRLTAGEQLIAISLRGSGPGVNTGVVSILAATADVLAHVRAPRPPESPAPVYIQSAQ